MDLHINMASSLDFLIGALSPIGNKAKILHIASAYYSDYIIKHGDLTSHIINGGSKQAYEARELKVYVQIAKHEIYKHFNNSD